MNKRSTFWFGLCGWALALGLAGWLVLHSAVPPSSLAVSTTGDGKGSLPDGGQASSRAASSPEATSGAAGSGAEAVTGGEAPPEDPKKALLSRKLQRILQLKAQKNRSELLKLLADPLSARWATDVLMEIEGDNPDAATTQAVIRDVVRNASVDANDRALVLQAFLGKGRVDASEWTRWALKQPDYPIRWHGFNYALHNMPVKQSLPIVLPFLDEPDVELRKSLFDQLRNLTGSFELPDQRKAWEAWWRKEGEAIFSRLP